VIRPRATSILPPGLFAGAAVRLAFLVGTLLLAGVGAIGTYSAQDQYDRTREDLIGYARSDARQIATVTANWLVVKDLATIEDLLLELAGAPNILGVTLTDTAGNVLVQVEQPPGQGPRAMYAEKSVPLPGLALIESGDDIATVWQPVAVGTEPIGWVRVRYSLAVAQAEQRAILIHTAVASGVVLVVMLGLLLFLLRRPLGILGGLSRFARSLGGLHGEQHPVVSSVTELNELQRALNDVSRELHDQDRRLAERERALSTLVGNLPGMVYRCRNDRDWTIEFASEGSLALTGYRPEELGENGVTTYNELIHPDDREPVWEQVQAALAEHRPFLLRYRVRSRDGQEKQVREHGRGIFTDDGVLMALEGYIADASAEARALEQAQKLSSAIEQTADSVIITDRDGVIEYVNPAFEHTTGYTRAEALGNKSNLVKSGMHDQAFYQRLWQTIRSGQPFREVFVNRRNNGTLFYEEKTISPLKDDRGTITHFVSTGKDITARMQSEQETRRTQHFLDSLVENLPNMLFVKDAKDLRFVRFNKAAEELLGYSRAEMIGKNDHDFFTKEEADFFTAMDREVLVSGELLDIPREAIHTRLQGTRLLHTKKIPISDEHGQPLYLLGISEDITERVQVEDTAQRLGRILDHSTNEIYVFGADGLRFMQVNQGAQKNLGYDMDELRALTPLDIKPDFSRESFEQLLAPLKSGEQEAISFVTNHRRRDGSLYPVEVHLQLSRNETPPVFVAIIQDITERKHAEDRLSYMAYYDTLTGLPNRQLLRDRLQQTMIEADRSGRVAAVMLLDLDRFKYINDTLGHEAGDMLLKGVAERLTTCVRHGDTVARLGGDEFTVLLANVAQVDDVAFVTKKILEAFAQPFTIAGRELFVSPSIGITLYPHDDRDIDNLLKNADAAMYHAKESGRNTFQFFTAELNERASQRLELETALRHALERNELLLHYQPLVDLKTGQLKGVEALLRWQYPQHGLVPPLDFIPLAEETGLIVPIGEWVLRTACAQAMAWHAAGFCGLQMAVNISSRQFQQQNLASVVSAVLNETGLEPQCFYLELTESVLMRNVDAAIVAMGELDAAGVGFSIDDFGTGYSSLSYLKRFPIDVLKIDRSFVRDITTNPDDAAIVTAIMAMAHTLGIEVVAEGVETEEQLAFLRAHGCDVMQGYYFSKPVDATALTELLRKTTKQGTCKPRTRKHTKADSGAR